MRAPMWSGPPLGPLSRGCASLYAQQIATTKYHTNLCTTLHQYRRINESINDLLMTIIRSKPHEAQYDSFSIFPLRGFFEH